MLRTFLLTASLLLPSVAFSADRNVEMALCRNLGMCYVEHTICKVIPAHQATPEALIATGQATTYDKSKGFKPEPIEVCTTTLRDVRTNSNFNLNDSPSRDGGSSPSSPSTPDTPDSPSDGGGKGGNKC